MARALAMGLIVCAVCTVAPMAWSRAAHGGQESTVRVSVDYQGRELTTDSATRHISSDGRWVVFDAVGAVPEHEEPQNHVYLLDRTTGRLTRESLGSSGQPGTWGGSHGVVSDDGRIVAFCSISGNLVEGDEEPRWTHGDPGYSERYIDVFVRNRVTGETWRASTAHDGSNPDGMSCSPSMSADGRFLVFESEATNLVPGDHNGYTDVFLYEVDSRRLRRVSTGWGGVDPNGRSKAPQISGDGRYVVFRSHATNLLNRPYDKQPNMFRWDRMTGVLEPTSTVAGTQEPAGSCEGGLAVSWTGQYVAMQCSTGDMVAGGSHHAGNLYWKDLDTNRTVQVATGLDGEPPERGVRGPQISAGGRYVLYATPATNMRGPPPTPSMVAHNLYRYDGQTQETRPVSLTWQDAMVEEFPGVGGFQLARFGQWVLFDTRDPTVVPDDTNERQDVFLRGPIGEEDRPAAAHDRPAGYGFDGDPTTTGRVDVRTPVDAGVAVSRFRFRGVGEPGTAPRHAVLARHDEHADALAGSVLTGDGPLLFTEPTRLPTASEAELRRVLAPGATVYLLGGERAIGPSVADELAARGYQPRRLAGPTRVETALAIAHELEVLHGPADRILLARAHGPDSDPTAAWADAVAAGGWSAKHHVPVLLTPSDHLHPVVRQWLEGTAVQRTLLLGGAAALSADVETAVPAPLRISGSDRAGTAAAVATRLWNSGATGARAFVISAGFHPEGWAYGLAAAGLVSDASAPLLLVGSTVPLAAADLVRTCGTPQVDMLIMGGPDVVPAQVATELSELDGGAC